MRTRRNRTKKYILGDHNVVDDVTGFVRKRSECQFTWDNLLVSRDQFDPKQPQIDIRGRADHISVRNARPEQPIKFKTDVKVDDI